MAEFSSKALAGTALGFGIGGTTLAAMNSGILPNLFGGGNRCVNSEDMPVNRYDAQKDARIAALETEVKLRDANTYTMGEVNKLRDHIDQKFDCVEKQLADQRTYNAVNTTVIGCVKEQVAQLMGLTQLKIGNSSVCPGWGNVTITPAAATTPTT